MSATNKLSPAAAAALVVKAAATLKDVPRCACTDVLAHLLRAAHSLAV